jgi:hypothetical protein
MKKKLVIALIVVVFMVGSLYGFYCFYFPFGKDHRCDAQLWFVLREYAEKNGGVFPAGQATPEASLSLIHSLDPSGGENAYLLHRRGVPCERVRLILERGELLGPDTCGWNYVEGLRLNSNPELALFWDKEGLNEIGGRLSEGGHIVSFVGSPCQYIPASRWDSFLEGQKKMFAEEKNKAATKDDSRQ